MEEIFSQACRERDLEKVKELLEKGVDVNSILLEATCHGQISIIIFLLDHGANIDYCD